MKNKDYPPAFIKALKEKNLPIGDYCAVFDECSTWKELNNLQYAKFAIAQKLAALGFMARRVTPVWGKAGLLGHKVEFQSFIPQNL